MSSFFVNDPAQKKLVFELVSGFDADNLSKIQSVTFNLEKQDYPISWVAYNILVINITDSTGNSLGAKLSEQIQSELHALIFHAEHLLGVINVFSTQKWAFTSHVKRL